MCDATHTLGRVCTSRWVLTRGSHGMNRAPGVRTCSWSNDVKGTATSSQLETDSNAEALRERLQEMQRSMEQFVNVVVHDLKSPLTSLKGYAQLAERRLDRGDQDGVRQSLAVIDRQINKMTRMLQSALDASRLESGGVQLRPTDLDLNVLVDELVHAARDANGHIIDWQGPQPPTVGCWDRDRIALALSNVLSNALAYSPRGTTVCVTVRNVDAKQSRETRDRAVEIAVRDEGVGIGHEDLERVFDRFYRAAGAVGVEGMGLGLYVARGLVALHGGRIWAESEGEGKGSTFFLRLPIATPQQARAE
jgi:signal transduction histidine kinase